MNRAAPPREPGTLIWVKYAGWPFWPARIAKETEVAPDLRKFRRRGSTLVRFFDKDADIAWMDLSDGIFKPFDPEVILEPKGLTRAKLQEFRKGIEEALQWNSAEIKVFPVFEEKNSQGNKRDGTAENGSQYVQDQESQSQSEEDTKRVITRRQPSRRKVTKKSSQNVTTSSATSTSSKATLNSLDDGSFSVDENDEDGPHSSTSTSNSRSKSSLTSTPSRTSSKASPSKSKSSQSSKRKSSNLELIFTNTKRAATFNAFSTTPSPSSRRRKKPANTRAVEEEEEENIVDLTLSQPPIVMPTISTGSPIFLRSPSPRKLISPPPPPAPMPIPMTMTISTVRSPPISPPGSPTPSDIVQPSTQFTPTQRVTSDDSPFTPTQVVETTPTQVVPYEYCTPATPVSPDPSLFHFANPTPITTPYASRSMNIPIASVAITATPNPTTSSTNTSTLSSFTPSIRSPPMLTPSQSLAPSPSSKPSNRVSITNAEARTTILQSPPSSPFPFTPVTDRTRSKYSGAMSPEMEGEPSSNERDSTMECRIKALISDAVAEGMTKLRDELQRDMALKIDDISTRIKEAATKEIEDIRTSQSNWKNETIKSLSRCLLDLEEAIRSTRESLEQR